MMLFSSSTTRGPRPPFVEQSSLALPQGRPRAAAARRRWSAPTRALFGDLLQRLGPGNTAWPPWQATVEPPRTGRKAKLLGEDLRIMRRLLEGCRLEAELRLPSPENDYYHHAAAMALEQQGALLAAALAVDPGAAASNAVPFTAGAISASAAPPRVEAVRSILPCLFAAEGKLDTRAAELLATRLALSQIQLLDFARIREGQSRCLPENVFWCGPSPFPSCRVAAAAMLHRMVTRRGGLLDKLPEVGGHAIVIAYPPADRQLAAEALALYLYLYCGFDLEQSAKEARLSLGAPVQPEALLPCLEELAAAVAGWQRRVKLVWPYAGGRVDISGEAVGGWDRKLPLTFDVRRRHWGLWLWGLSPGIYRCKFIVDGRWCVDLAAPTESDGRGNINNVVMVPEGPELHPWQRQASGGSCEEAVAGAAEAGGGAAGAAGTCWHGGDIEGDSMAPAGREAPRAASQAEARGVALLGMLGEEPAALEVDLRQLDPGKPEGHVSEAAATALLSSGEAVSPLGATGDWEQGGAAGPRSARLEQQGDVVRFGAMLLAFYTKLSVQRRVTAVHH